MATTLWWQMLWLWLLSLVFFSNSQYLRQSAIKFNLPSFCTPLQHFSTINFTCIPCPNGLAADSNRLACDCSPDSLRVNFTTSGPVCQQCPEGQVVFGGRCIKCFNGICGCPSGQILNGTGCFTCQIGFEPNKEQSECSRCETLECLCKSGGCAPPLENFSPEVWLSDGSTVRSTYIQEELSGASQRCQVGSEPDCQALLNMCVLQNLDKGSTACSLIYKIAPQMMSLLYVDGDADSEIHRESALPRQFAMGDRLDFYVATFHKNGTFLEMVPLRRSSLLICSENDDGRENVTMGTRINRNCRVRIGDLKKKELFLEVLLYFTDSEGESKMYPLPVLIRQMRVSGQFPNKPSESNRWQLGRRFFLVDASGQTTNSTTVIRYASRIQIHVTMQPSRDGLIFPPYIDVDHREIVTPDDFDSVEHSFSVTFLADPERHDRDVEITMAVLAPSSIILAGLRTYSWGRRSGKELLSDASAILQFLLFSAGCLGDVFFLITSIIAIWLTFIYKIQHYVFYNVLDESQEATLRTYLLVSVLLKALSLAQKIFELVTQRTFFIDWERPRPIADISKRPMSQDSTRDTKEFPPVAWRTYLVANEWSELFNYRKTSVPFQLLAMLALLEFFGWKNLAIVEPGLSRDSQLPSAESTFLTRFGVYVFCYLSIGFIQWIVQVIVLERILLDPFHNFIDLCSVANISVLSLTNSLFGYYVHGRSVHGRADASMGEMNEFLQRERDNLCGSRGLEAGSELQTFYAALPVSFQKRYDEIMKNDREGPRLSGFDQITAKMTVVSRTHEQMNIFLKELIDHSLSDVDYMTRDRPFVEALLDVDTTDTSIVGTLTRDESEMAFSRCFLYGNEWSFLSFECALFCLISLLTDSLIIASLLVYLLSFAIRCLCSVLARGQLARCSLVDNRFLW